MADRILEPTHNGGVSNETFMRYLAEHRKLEVAMNDVKAKQKALSKQATEDGVPIADIKEALKRTAADPGEYIERENRIRWMLQNLKAPLGTQLQLIEEPPAVSSMSDAQLEQKWEDEGFAAGVAAKLNRSDNPHDPGTKAFQCWERGWQQGQAKNAAAIKKGPPSLLTEPKESKLETSRRKRPRSAVARRRASPLKRSPHRRQRLKRGRRLPRPRPLATPANRTSRMPPRRRRRPRPPRHRLPPRRKTMIGKRATTEIPERKPSVDNGITGRSEK